MGLRVDLFAEDPARGEDGHGRHLTTQLRQRLLMELLRIGLGALAEPVAFRLRLRADLRCRGFRRLRRALGDGRRLPPRLAQQPLDLGLHLGALTLRRLGVVEAFADPFRTGVESLGDRAPEESLEEIEEQPELHDGDEHPVGLDQQPTFREDADRHHGVPIFT